MSATVYIVDDDTCFRAAIQRQLEQAGYRVVAYASAEQVLEQPPNENEPSCILLDVRMPVLSGLELQSRLLERGSTLPILFLTGYFDVSATVKAIKAGAEDFLIKPVQSDDLLGAIERALARHRSALALQREFDDLRSRFASLTPRERQVFVFLVAGKTSRQVADELGTTVRTIKAHRKNVMEKMKAGSRAELVLMGERLGVGTPHD
ncbi:response regulator transcription factor [Bradyrhizobium cajani]|uniref:Response regulator n=1 Tax=Bradyrhizobium cajani TaxID=1928661 RepID=A0A844TRZ3_9BRAD|nr:response regulator [Bradyrhizobium cajani]MCP3374517.1 response regulator [Bradyrhizobium cajani]MVT78554.1 response regulator [Bradyrhizobium cajani]